MKSHCCFPGVEEGVKLSHMFFPEIQLCFSHHAVWFHPCSVGIAGSDLQLIRISQKTVNGTQLPLGLSLCPSVSLCPFKSPADSHCLTLSISFAGTMHLVLQLKNKQNKETKQKILWLDLEEKNYLTWHFFQFWSRNLTNSFQRHPLFESSQESM